MRTDTRPTIATGMPSGIHKKPSRSWFWPGIGVATIGLAIGLTLGITSYQDSQQAIDAFARIAVPGTVTVQVEEPGPQVIYYEGDEGAGIEGLGLSITDPVGATVAAAPYEGELIYEATEYSLTRAVASFDATQIGAYEIEVTGLDTGLVTVGESVARLALPGVLAGLVIAGLSLLAGFALWLYSALKR